MFKQPLFILALFSVGFLAACGEDKSVTDDPAALSSSAEDALSSSDAEGAFSSSSGALLSSSSATNASSSSGKGILVDDFEDGNNESLLETFWYVYDDADNGAASTYATPLDSADNIATTASGYNSTNAFGISYKLDQGGYKYDPYVGFGVTLPESVNSGKIAGVSYYFKGGAHFVRIETSDIADYDFYQYSVKAASDWTLVTIRFKDMAQKGYGTKVDFDATHISAVSWQVLGDGNTDSVFLDNIYLMDSSEVAKDAADMTINAAVIPEVTIGDITVSNPLQAKAMKYLNKGINITNWLENADGKFKSFEFDESDVKLMSDNGIQGLRLPIDLDLYVTNRDEFLADTEGSVELLMDDSIFVVLDSFVDWTARYGMSFTIDYHEYDNSYNATTQTDAQYLAMMAGVWKAVAAHYASNSREDLFYELLNEPDMTNGKATSANWTIAAQGMIDSIRTVDTKHTIIFGDAQWYSISLLAKRTPFSDDNIVYAFHSYDPFVFTHQGASWAETATIKNIPFPYDTTKWSSYSSDFGVNSSTASWVKTAVKNYYKTGSMEYILQTVLKAKEWAVTNNVPLVWNEFGAYNGSSDAESRLNYLKAVRTISDTLQIPFQHWGYTGGFSLFENGKLIDGVKEALDLE